MTCPPPSRPIPATELRLISPVTRGAGPRLSRPARRRSACRSMATRPTAPARCWTRWRAPTRTSTARSNRLSHRADATPKTPSRSTCRQARRRVPPARSPPCARYATGRSRASPRHAPAARWPRAAPPHRTGARSASDPTKRSSPAPAHARATRMESRLQGHAPQGRTQDRPSDAPKAPRVPHDAPWVLAVIALGFLIAWWRRLCRRSGRRCSAASSSPTRQRPGRIARRALGG